jgi:hypothetical protein
VSSARQGAKVDVLRGANDVNNKQHVHHRHANNTTRCERFRVLQAKAMRKDLLHLGDGERRGAVVIVVEMFTCDSVILWYQVRLTTYSKFLLPTILRAKCRSSFLKISSLTICP